MMRGEHGHAIDGLRPTAALAATKLDANRQLHKKLINLSQKLEKRNMGGNRQNGFLKAHNFNNRSWNRIGAYAGSKGRTVSLSNQLAVESGPRVRVNSVLLGPILTPVWKTATAQYVDEVKCGSALLCKGQPGEFAETVRFLISDNAFYISAASLLVDGWFAVGKDLSHRYRKS
jgi:NAD(P)-dependent dehydrogenase (short-subunit alcohol dehydrogenase family)